MWLQLDIQPLPLISLEIQHPKVLNSDVKRVRKKPQRKHRRRRRAHLVVKKLSFVCGGKLTSKDEELACGGDHSLMGGSRPRCVGRGDSLPLGLVVVVAVQVIIEEALGPVEELAPKQNQLIMAHRMRGKRGSSAWGRWLGAYFLSHLELGLLLFRLLALLLFKPKDKWEKDLPHA